MFRFFTGIFLTTCDLAKDTVYKGAGIFSPGDLGTMDGDGNVFIKGRSKNMQNNELTYNDFLQRLNIQELLVDAGYQLNKRDGGIHRYLLLLVGVFIGKSGKGMAKLMHHYRLEPFLVAGGEIV